MAAPLDCLAYLPAPPLPANAGVAALLRDELLAVATGCAVALVEVRTLAVAGTLVGARRGAAVSALAWASGAAPEAGGGAPLLAAGDDEGRAVVWDAGAGAALAALAPAGGRRGESGPPVRGLAWTGAGAAARRLLAVLNAAGNVALWDVQDGAVLWRADLGGGGGGEPFVGLAADPLDCGRVAAYSAGGAFVVLHLGGAGAGRPPRQRRYQAQLARGGSLTLAFAGARDLLLLLLQRELLVFDLEYGLPAGTTALPPGMAPFAALLGARGHAAGGAGPAAPGVDVVYCSHADGSVSAWRRAPGTLGYGLASACALAPPPPARAPGSNSSAAAPAPPRIVSVAAAVPPAPAAGGGGEAGDAAGGEAGGPLVVVGVSAGGALWQWHLPLLGAAGPSAPPPPPLAASLRAMAHWLPARVTSFGACAAPGRLPGAPRAAALLAAGTAGGGLEVVAVGGGRGGAGSALRAEVVVSLECHAAPVRGVQWLGATPRVAAFSSAEAGAPGRYASEVTVTDLRTRSHARLRGGGSAPGGGGGDAGPVVGIRASPSGRHLLVVLRGAPSEVWVMAPGGGGGGEPPVRARQLDLQFAAAEWIAGDAGGGGAAGSAASTPRAGGGATPRAGGGATPRAGGGGAPPGDGFWPDAGGGGGGEPEERLAFALADGRVGVLAVRGRHVADAKPRRPAWAPLTSGDFRATAAAALGGVVFFGDAEGRLAAWDTASGAAAAAEAAEGGRVVRLAAAPPPRRAPPGARARLAVLLASGSLQVFDLLGAPGGGGLALRAAHPAASARAGAVVDVGWLPLPPGGGGDAGGAVLAASLRDGGLALLDATPAGSDERRRLRAACRGGGAPGALPPPPPAGGPLLLPRGGRALLRALLRHGVPPAVFDRLAAARDGGAELEAVGAAVLACLPRGALAEWEAAAAVAAAAAAPPAGALEAGADAGALAARLGALAAGDGPAPAAVGLALADAARALGRPALLAPAEAAAYAAAVRAGGVARRMEVAALAVERDADEAATWAALAAAADRGGGGADDAQPAWEGIADAAERGRWHARLDRGAVEASEALAQARAVELVALGDLHGAVGLLLAAPPDALPARFYRSSLAAVALAGACASSFVGGAAGGGGGGPEPPAPAPAGLLAQALKVTVAAAAGAGDALLGVPLLVAAGDAGDAVALLQREGLWAPAAALAARALAGAPRAAAVERWARQVAGEEGRPWAAARLALAGGPPGAAAALLRGAGLPGAADALAEAEAEAAAARGGGGS